MAREEITLSYALDLIAQSKGDIKTSVQGKGGTIGDDLTEYSVSIDNIQFRTLSFTKNSVTLNKWSSDTLDMTQYLDGRTSMPDDFTYAMTYVSGADPNANVVMSDNNGAKRFMITPVDYGTSTLNIHDNMGNCDYPISVEVSTVDINVDAGNSQGDNAGFTFFGYPSDDTEHPVGPDEPTGDWVADWDSTAQSFYANFNMSTPDGYAVPYADIQVEVEGEMIDNNLITVTVGAVQGYSNVFRLTFTPATDPNSGDPVLYNGIIMFKVTDGTSESTDRTICFREGTDYVPASNYYFYNPSYNGVDVIESLDPNDPDYDGTYKVDIIVIDGDGNEVNLDDVFTHTTIDDTDNNGLSIGYDSEDLGQGYEETTRVYVIIPENTSGSATLTYDDGNGNSCMTTFTYNITVQQNAE